MLTSMSKKERLRPILCNQRVYNTPYVHMRIKRLPSALPGCWLLLAASGQIWKLFNFLVFVSFLLFFSFLVFLLGCDICAVMGAFNGLGE